jgi:hypothetical protein
LAQEKKGKGAFGGCNSTLIVCMAVSEDRKEE